ncbi:MAG TPA: hypothetical protein VGM80_07425 [Gaiellaceae bacterium]
MRRTARSARQARLATTVARRIAFLAVILANLQASIANAAGPDFGAVIEQRFAAAHYAARTLPAVPHGQKPTRSFYVLFDLGSPHVFWFVVFVFPTRAAASAARGHDLGQLEKIGTPGDYKIVQAGKVVYLGETGPINPGTTVLPARFAAALAIAEGHRR